LPRGYAVATVDVQIITYAPTVFYHCQHCEIAFSEVGLGDRVHREQALAALPEDLRRDFEDLSAQIHQAIERFGNKLRVRVVDAASIEGVFKSLRYRAHNYPEMIVNGHRYDGGRPLLEVVAGATDDPIKSQNVNQVETVAKARRRE
jgi:hypothetical protein